MQPNIYLDSRNRASYERTQLIIACINHDIDGVKKYINQARTIDLTFRTALMYAAERGFVEGVKILKQYEIGLKDRWGMKAYDYAKMECDARYHLSERTPFKQIMEILKEELHYD